MVTLNPPKEDKITKGKRFIKEKSGPPTTGVQKIKSALRQTKRLLAKVPNSTFIRVTRSIYICISRRIWLRMSVLRQNDAWNLWRLTWRERNNIEKNDNMLPSITRCTFTVSSHMSAAADYIQVKFFGRYLVLKSFTISLIFFMIVN